jgi:hypothetical protein
MGPVWNVADPDRGAVCQGPVGAPWLGRFRAFQYEVRCWPGGYIPDIAEAVDSPRRLSEDRSQVAAVLAALRHVPPLTWGRDELRTGDMWNSNSIVSWALARSGHDMVTIRPPAQGRAPGWKAGLTLAAREQPIEHEWRPSDPMTRWTSTPPGTLSCYTRTENANELSPAGADLCSMVVMHCLRSTVGEREPIADAIADGPVQPARPRIQWVGKPVDASLLAVEHVGDEEDLVSFATRQMLRPGDLHPRQQKLLLVSGRRLHLEHQTPALVLDQQVVTEGVVALAIAKELVSVARPPALPLG